MPLGHSGYYIPLPWLVWLMFLGLILLAALFMQVLHWESRFNAGRKVWLTELKHAAKRLRLLRFRLTRMQDLPGIDAPLNWIQPLFRGLGSVVFRLLKMVLAAKLRGLA